ncbi:triose-phosphate isomerase [Sphingomonas sp. AP4-R1]|uniref:triose-phosphate isomerase n=1 Tax=Sphingomonas sp. AP4-R1 TaxID=2735134 RepID=UPI00149393BD|nr:triose-phosphate isomerase [Sphingomonas sp. AP4-R1]QJU56397.1 triose-phosphate isomerase [Sphingomonas sp. AP4-R1]
MALRKLVAGNWKMNGTRAKLAELDGIVSAADAAPGVDVAICPPFTLIDAAVAAAPSLPIGAQDCHHAVQGAHTGCVSAEMIVDLGARYVILGHSERRTDQHETDRDARGKALAAFAAGLTAIICVGETGAQRDAGRAGIVVAGQLEGSIPATGTAANLVIAYEPVWAIGSGRTPSLAEVKEMHGLIRAKLEAILGIEGAGVRILYGGSVNPGNAAELLAVPDVDGALVGGASLTAAQFVPIIEAAAAL